MTGQPLPHGELADKPDLQWTARNNLQRVGTWKAIFAAIAYALLDIAAAIREQDRGVR